MNAKLIDGRGLSTEIRDSIKSQLKELTLKGQRSPHLAVILVGDDPASEVYVQHKEKACQGVGILSRTIRLGENSAANELEQIIDQLNSDHNCDAILLQLPLPAHLDRVALVSKIHPSKDVDGITPYNEGLLVWGKEGLQPCTPLGIMRLIKQEVPSLPGKVAAVVGRSALVGMPMGTMLERAGCTLLGLHSDTINPWEWTSKADILVVATGVKHLVDQKWIKPGAVVIDVGIHRDGPKLTGDVKFEDASKIAGAITPVPGGVGPMTIAMLVSNCFQAYLNNMKSLG